MRKLIFTLLILVGFTAALQAEHVRAGIIAAAEFAEKPSIGEFFDTLGENTDLYPGIYGEVIIGHIGFGGTLMARFLHEDPPTGPREWTVDWIGTIDVRYHFLKRCFLDPFVELSAGCAGQADMTGALWDEDNWEDNLDVLAMSLFAQAGLGVAVRLDHFHVGGKFVYRFANEPIPGTDIALYPLNSFQIALFAGVSF